MCQALSEEATAKLELQHEVKTLYKEYKVVSGQLEKKVEELAKLTPRNVTRIKNKQAKRKQESAARTSNSRKISGLEKENDELNKSLDSALRTTLALRKSVI